MWVHPPTTRCSEQLFSGLVCVEQGRDACLGTYNIVVVQGTNHAPVQQCPQMSTARSAEETVQMLWTGSRTAI